MGYFEQAGVMGYPLLLCSFFAVAIIIERCIFFLLTHPVSQKVISNLLKQGRKPLAKNRIQKLQRNFFGKTLLQLRETKGSAEEVDHFFSIHLSSIESKLARNLSFLKIIAMISPLLGLLGTILGMVEAFEAISHSKDPVTPSLIAGGISKALVTTALGLVIAIPSLLTYHLFRLRVGHLMQKLMEQMNQLQFHWQRTSRG